MVKPENPAAFPCDDNTMENGMTLRDYFAAAAIQGVKPTFERKGGIVNATDYECLASYCYEIADAMLAARVKP